MGVGLTVLAYPIMNVLYPNSNAAGPGLLAIMGAASFFVCTVLMENAILQASGHEKLTMVTMISGGLVKIIVYWFLVAQRSINIYGAPVGTLVSYVVMALMNYIFICVALKHRPKLFGIFARPLAASVLMGAAAWAIYGLCSHACGHRRRGDSVSRVDYRAPLHHQRGHETHPRRGKNREFLAHPLIFM